MALHDPDRPAPSVEPADQLAVVHAFLRRARAWAIDQGVPRAQARLASEPSPEHASKLRDWLTYIAFTEHTLQELEDGTLDHWFTGEPP